MHICRLLARSLLLRNLCAYCLFRESFAMAPPVALSEGGFTLHPVNSSSSGSFTFRLSRSPFVLVIFHNCRPAPCYGYSFDPWRHFNGQPSCSLPLAVALLPAAASLDELQPPVVAVAAAHTEKLNLIAPQLWLLQPPSCLPPPAACAREGNKKCQVLAVAAC